MPMDLYGKGGTDYINEPGYGHDPEMEMHKMKMMQAGMQGPGGMQGGMEQGNPELEAIMQKLMMMMGGGGGPMGGGPMG